MLSCLQLARDDAPAPSSAGQALMTNLANPSLHGIVGQPVDQSSGLQHLHEDPKTSISRSEVQDKMPRKNKTAHSVAENREAQRRSRARRQELISDLQRRREEYERTGVAESLEMQRVDAQNQRLRSLLGVYGVSEGEIEWHLSSPEEDRQALNSQQRCTTCQSLLPVMPQSTATSVQESSQGPSGSALGGARGTGLTLTSVSSAPSLPISARNQVLSTEPGIESIPGSRKGAAGVFVFSADESDMQRQMSAVDRDDDTTTGYHSAVTGTFSPLPGSHDSPDLTLCHSKRPRPLETSCDKAAKILVDLHNQTDLSSAHSALGCRGDSSNCSIKNIKFFQLMDHLN